MQYRNKFLVETGPAEGKQLPNLYTLAGSKSEDGVDYLGLIQEGQKSSQPTWFSLANIISDFEVVE